MTPMPCFCLLSLSCPSIFSVVVHRCKVYSSMTAFLSQHRRATHLASRCESCSGPSTQEASNPVATAVVVAVGQLPLVAVAQDSGMDVTAALEFPDVSSLQFLAVPPALLALFNFVDPQPQEEKPKEEWVPFASLGTKFVMSIRGGESLLDKKAHGTCIAGVQQPLRWDVPSDLADDLCCFSRNANETFGFWEQFLPAFERTPAGKLVRITFYDSVTGKPVFRAPVGRSWQDFLSESKACGRLSFRDSEVVKANVRVLMSNEVVSTDGTQLGWNSPDYAGNRWTVNLVSVAGQPPSERLIE